MSQSTIEAAPAPEQPTKKKPKKALWIVGIIVAVLIIAGIGNAIGGGSKDEATPATQSDGAAPAAGEPAAEEAPAAEEPTIGSWADDKYGTFETMTQSGTGDSVVALPEGVDAAMVTATHDGSRNFAVQAITPANEPTMDLLVNTIGAYSGVTAYGLNGNLGDAANNLKVTADGNWTITIAPLSTAPELGASGAGDAVFLYSGGAANAAITHDGSRNFSFTEHTDAAFNFGLLVNEIGAYSGTVPMSAGPSVINVDADGNWTVALG
ncbi:hypothetical protein [Salinibacterium sp. ZJ450]|uniref:hypothetical protein n=1 Tax=Salinibacterium sp. ZJ450 TaxID=2708338 RepID=UPI001420FD6F|nr:hypothetical protein [Salinibacterium sp. ZJ450]